jgi:hypothetical protein
MDASTMTQGGVSAGVFVILAGLYKFLNHHKVRARCCGRSFDASVDIDSTEPTDVSPTNATPFTTAASHGNPINQAIERESKLDHEKLSEREEKKVADTPV